jgi:hypothetical protein
MEGVSPRTDEKSVRGFPAVRAAWPYACLFAFAAALSACTLLRGIGPHDEGLMLQAAARVADGQWPYRDFWWNYGPGQPLVLAPVAHSLLGWRIVRVALDATVAVLAYALARRTAPPWIAALAGVAAAGAMAWPATPGPNPAALALVLGALLLAPGRPGWAGALCALAAFFRPELGVAGALSVALYVRATPAAASPARPLLVALGVTVVLYAAPFALAPGDFLRDTVGFLGVQDLQRLPLPLHYRGGVDPNKVLEFYFPLILLVGSALWLAARRGLWLAPLVLAGVLYLVGRPDEFHLVPLAVVLSFGLAQPRLALVAVLALIAVHGLERRAGQLLHPPPLAAIADGVETSPADARALHALLPRIHALAPPGTPIFVAPPRFDRVRVGDPLLYVLADRPNPTRYDVLQPGVVTTARVQREMVRDLRRARPPVLVRWVDPRARATEPNGSSRSSGVTLLDDHLRATYRRAARFGPYVLYRVAP